MSLVTRSFKSNLFDPSSLGKQMTKREERLSASGQSIIIQRKPRFDPARSARQARFVPARSSYGQRGPSQKVHNINIMRSYLITVAPSNEP
ncbi:hypothetical protein YC2023_033297 [Brassica napus]